MRPADQQNHYTGSVSPRAETLAVAQDYAGFVVEVVPAHAIAAFVDDIRALEARSIEPNAFAGSDFLLAAARHFPGHLAPTFLCLRARQPGGSGDLVGLLGIHAPGGRAIPILRGWSHPLQPLGAPLIDRACAVPALAALFAFLDRSGLGRSGLCLSRIATDGPLAAAIAEAASLHGGRVEPLARHERALLALPHAARWTKERRRQKRRLAEQGHLTLRLAETYADVRPALERFLTLEATGWKGGRGSALLSDPNEANFTRAMLWSAAQRGNAILAELVLDDRVIASTIVLAAGDRGYIWKIAHDEAFGAYSPGALLLLEVSDWAIGDGRFTALDSCALPGTSVIEQIWPDRLLIGDLVVQLSRLEGGYRAAVARERLRRSLRARAKIIYHRLRAMAA